MRDFAVGARESVQAPEEVEVLARGQVGIDRQVLRHVADLGLERGRARVHRLAGDADLALVAAEDPADHRDRRGLAGPVRTEQAVRLAASDGEADAIDGLPVAEALAQAGAFEDRRADGVRRSRVPALRRPAGSGRRDDPDDGAWIGGGAVAMAGRPRTRAWGRDPIEWSIDAPARPESSAVRPALGWRNGPRQAFETTRPPAVARLDDPDGAGQVRIRRRGDERGLDPGDPGHRVGEGEDGRPGARQEGADRARLARRIDHPRQLRVDRRPVRLVEPVHGQPGQELVPPDGEAGDADRDRAEVGHRVLERHRRRQGRAHVLRRQPQLRDEQRPRAGRAARRTGSRPRHRRRRPRPTRRTRRGAPRRRCPGGPRSRRRGRAARTSTAPRRRARCPPARHRPSPPRTTRARARAGCRCASRSASRPRRAGRRGRLAAPPRDRGRTGCRDPRSARSGPRPRPSARSRRGPRRGPRGRSGWSSRARRRGSRSRRRGWPTTRAPRR